MRFPLFLIPALLLASADVGAQEPVAMGADAISLRLDSLIESRHLADRRASIIESPAPTDPYIFRLLCPGTLYSSTLSRTLSLGWKPTAPAPPRLSLRVANSLSEPELLQSLIDRQYARLYTDFPSLVSVTEDSILSERPLWQGFDKPLANDLRFTDMATPSLLASDFSEPIVPLPRKPRFWTLKGSGSLQFTQSYYSDNWYQGGEKNYAELSMFTFEANYDNKRKVQWDNKLEVQLGFQTSSDTVHKVKVTSNLLRYTTNLGYQAAHDWYYTGSLVTYTQIMRFYDTNANTYSTGFASPLYLTLSVGMTYKFASKGGAFSGSLLLSPIAYNMRYVACDSLRERYSVEQGKKAYHNFGPSLTLTHTLSIAKNVSWESRLYYFTNLKYVDFEWENTFTFTINKYLSAKLFLYPRFDDSSTAYRGDKGYLMFKQWLSLGLSFDF